MTVLVTGKYDPVVSPAVVKSSTYVTRGSNLQLQKNRFKFDLWKYSFTKRVVNSWNSLPDFVDPIC